MRKGPSFIYQTWPVQRFTLGCIECPWEKIFSSQSTNKGNRKLPFDMGFKNIEKFFRNFNVSCSHQRAEVTENRDFPWKSTVFCWNICIFNYQHTLSYITGKVC